MSRPSSIAGERKKSQIPHLQSTQRRSSSHISRASSTMLRHSSIRTPLAKSPRITDGVQSGGFLSRVLLDKGVMRRSSVIRLSLLDKRQGAPKDNRNLSDKACQAQSIKKIASFLQSMGCTFTISPRLSSKTFKREFLDSFLFLARIIDPNYEMKKEEDFLGFLKFLGYPCSGLTKSVIYNATSLTCCIKLLMVLDWLVDVARYHASVDVSSLFSQKNDLEYAKPIQKKIIDQVGNAYKLFLKEGRQVDNEEIFEKIFEESYGNLNTLCNKDKEELRLLTEKDTEITERLFQYEQRLLEIQTLEEDFEKLTVYVENQKRYNEEDAIALKMQEEVLAKLQNDYQVTTEQLKEAEAKLLKQQSTFSHDVFKMQKTQNEEHLKQLRNQNAELQEECNRLGVSYSKEKFEFLNNCTKMEADYTKKVEMLKNMFKEEVEIPPFPALKNLQTTNVREAIETFIHKLKVLRGKLRNTGEREMELAACLKNVQAQRDALEKENRDMYKQHEQQIAQLEREEHKLDEKIKTLELEAELKEEELAKIQAHSTQSHSNSAQYQRECIQLQSKVRQLRERNDLEEKECGLMLQELYQLLSDQITEMENAKEVFRKESNIKLEEVKTLLSS